MRRGSWALMGALSACGGGTATDDGGPASLGGSQTETSAASVDGSTDDGAGDTDGSGGTSSAGTDSGGVDATGDGSGDTGGGAGGPVVVYSGPFADAVIPGWNADSPAPLLFMGRQAGDPTWWTTLASIDPAGVLGTNVSTDIVVWGFAVEPPRLYEGAFVGGQIPGWSVDDPTPVLMMGRASGDDTWIATLAAIGPAGELMETLVDEVIVWGWPAGTPAAPGSLYDGPVDGMGSVPGWNAEDPRPLVMAGREDGSDVWRSTLASIAQDGVLGDNVSARLVVWGWP